MTSGRSSASIWSRSVMVHLADDYRRRVTFLQQSQCQSSVTMSGAMPVHDNQLVRQDQAMSGAVHLWHVSLERTPQEAAAFAADLSDDELARAKRLRDPRRSRRFIVGRSALRLVLGRWRGCAAAEIRFTY